MRDRTSATERGPVSPEGEGGFVLHDLALVLERLDRIESKLDALVGREAVKEWYTPEEFAKAVGRSSDSVRRWCLRGRIEASKRRSLCGPHQEWKISRAELDRYRSHGLLPTREGLR